MAPGAEGPRSGGKRGLLVIGGSGPDSPALRELARGADLVAAADSGLVAVLAAGLEPDLVVGDMDSLPDRRLLERVPGARIREFPRDKDETDTEIGLRLLREQGCGPVTLAGGGGGRVDHLFGVALLFERERPPERWLTDAADIRLVDGAVELSGWEGSTVSVFPLGEQAAGMESEGLRWPLNGLVFRRGYAGISNVVTGRRLRIRVATGRLLLVRCLAGAA